MRSLLLAATCIAALLAAAGSASAIVITVTNTNDSGAGSLRQAITDSNASIGTKDDIWFNIPGSGLHTITLTSALPEITDPVTINGGTQPGYSLYPLIELDGSGIPTADAVLTISAGQSTVSSLGIIHGPDAGIRLRTNNSNTIIRCTIGVDPTGAIAQGNAGDGIVIESIGGNSIGNSGNGNVIGGNGGHGIHAVGTHPIANLAQDNMIGLDWYVNPGIGNGGYGALIDSVDGFSFLSNYIYGNASGGVRYQGPCVGGYVLGGWILYNGGPGVTVDAQATQIDYFPQRTGGNAGLEIDLEGDGPTPNDPFDVDTGANGRLNHPVVRGVVLYAYGGSQSLKILADLDAAPLSNYTVRLYGGVIGADGVMIWTQVPVTVSSNTDATGHFLAEMFVELPRETRYLALLTQDAATNTSEFSPAFSYSLTADSGCGLTGLEGFAVLLLAALVRRARRG